MDEQKYGEYCCIFYIFLYFSLFFQIYICIRENNQFYITTRIFVVCYLFDAVS